MRSWLRKPYPFLYEGPFNRLKVAGFVLVFVILFLYVFRPFNIEEIHAYEPIETALIIGFTSGIVSFLGASILIKIYPNYANEKSWNIGREMILMLSILLLVSIANYFVGLGIRLFPDHSLSPFELAISTIVKTFAVGFFPVMIITFVNYTVLIKRNISNVEKHQFSSGDLEPELIIKAPSIVEIKSSTRNNDIQLDLDQLIFIMADGNYIEFHSSINDETVREIRRNTVNNISKQLIDYHFIFKTHRAFMVNLNKITQSKGNAQGYQLKLEGTETWVPVSRGNLTRFDEVIKKEKKLVEQLSV